MIGSLASDINLARKQRAWTLRTRGKTYEQIAEALERERLGRVAVPTILQWLAEVRGEIRSDLLGQALTDSVEQLEALRAGFSESWDAWEKSKEADRLLREKEITPEGPAPALPGEAPQPVARARGRKETVHELRDQCGDPRYLSEARAHLADIRKIVGMEPPERKEIALHMGSPKEKLLARIAEMASRRENGKAMEVEI